MNFHLLPEICRKTLPAFLHGLVHVHLDGERLLGDHSHLLGFGMVPFRHPLTRHLGVQVDVGRRSIHTSGSVLRPRFRPAFLLPAGLCADGILIVFFWEGSTL